MNGGVSLGRVARLIGEQQLKLLQAEEENEALTEALEAKEDELRASQADGGRRARRARGPDD